MKFHLLFLIHHVLLLLLLLNYDEAKRNITNERESLYDALKTFENEGLDYGNKLFTSGTSHPNLGDIAIFGTLHSIRGLKAHDDVIHSRGGITKSWYERMLNIVVKK